MQINIVQLLLIALYRRKVYTVRDILYNVHKSSSLDHFQHSVVQRSRKDIRLETRDRSS